VILALHDHDCFSGNSDKNLISRSAAFMRSTVRPALDGNNNNIDRGIRLVLTANGPEYHNIDTIIANSDCRRVRNLYYTREFAELVRTETLLSRIRMRSVIIRIIARMTQDGSCGVRLLPTKVAYWWPLVEDIFGSDVVAAKSDLIMKMYFDNQELAAISVDGTFRCCLSIAGQSSFRAPKEERERAAFGDAEALRRVLTVRGRTGAVIDMRAVRSEASSDIAEALTAGIPMKYRNQVLHYKCDNPTSELFSQLQKVFPKLQSMSLDCIHLPIVYESAMWKKRSAGSIVLRQIMAKFHKRPSI